MRALLVILIAAGLAFAAWTLLAPTESTDDGYGIDGEDEAFDEEGTGPMLRADENARARAEAARRAAEAEAARRAAEAQPDESNRRIWLRGLVLEAGSNKPIAGATLAYEPASSPCPRLPGGALPGRLRHRLVTNPDGTAGSVVVAGDHRFSEREQLAVTNAVGRFEVEVPANWKPSGAVDLMASALGYVTGMHCQIPTEHPVGDDIVIRLERARQLTGRVVDPEGRPVPDAWVHALPEEGNEPAPGNSAYVATDAQGRFVLEPLGKAAVMLRIDHPGFMVRTVGPHAPGDATLADIVLTPAYRLRFRVRSADADPLKNITASWRTDGDVPLSDVQILGGVHEGPPSAPKSVLLTDEIRIPADRRTVTIEVKADGYETWRTENEPIPADGGEHTFEVSLSRDGNLAGLTLTFLDPKGETVAYSGMNAAPPRITWRGAGRPQGALVMEPGESLRFPSLPAGPWRIELFMPGYAPVTLEEELTGGEQRKRQVQLTPPARVRLRFVASEALQVRFRLVREAGGEPVRAWVASEGGARAAGEEGDLSGAATAEGWVEITGLAEGDYVVEVTTANLVARSRVVTASVKNPAQYEIDVSRR